jgi:hypothetical protein
MRIFHAHALWLTAIVMLNGCGGGGGGGQPNLPPVAQSFTAWSAVQPNSKVTAQGMSQTMAATFTVAANGDVTITSISPFSTVDTGVSSATLTFGSSRQLTGLQINAPAGSASWDATLLGGGSVSCGNGVCTASKNSGASEALTIDPYFVGWNYQSFGVWQTGTTTSGTFGAMSFGAPTPVGGLPSIVNAVYTGLTAGVYVDATGQLFGTSATMSTTVNFVARTVNFSTTGTVVSRPSVVGTTPNAGLDLSGTVTYAPGTAQFLVPVATANSQLSGTANGRFYGPAAQEIGGVYSLQGAGQSMGGAFGGKR